MRFILVNADEYQKEIHTGLEQPEGKSNYRNVIFV